MKPQLAFLGVVVKDVAAATEFYTQKLGLKVDEKESVPNFYTQFVTEGGAIFGLLGGFAERDDLSQTFDPGLLVEDVDGVYAKWQAAGVEMLDEPHDMPFGRTFLCRTPDGHILRVYRQPSAG